MNNNEVVVPAQIKAARAMLDWSQEQLAKEAKIGVTSVRDCEAMRRGEDVGAVAAMRKAFENAGIEFIPGAEGSGPGVRMAGNRPRVILMPTKMTPYGFLHFSVEWRGRRVMVFIPGPVLEDLADGQLTGQPDDAAYVAVFKSNMAYLLRKTAAVIESNAERVAPDGRLHFRIDDFDDMYEAKRAVLGGGGFAGPTGAVPAAR